MSKSLGGAYSRGVGCFRGVLVQEGTNLNKYSIHFIIINLIIIIIIFNNNNNNYEVLLKTSVKIHTNKLQDSKV